MDPTKNRAQRRYIARMEKKEKYSPRESSVRVVMRVDLSLSFEDELMVLTALEELKRQNNQLNIEYVTADENIFRILKNRWFLKKSHLIKDIEELDTIFEAIIGDDFSLVIELPDRDEAIKAEEEIYSASHQKIVAELEQRQRSAQEQGMKDLKLAIPDYMFVPRWHKTNGFLWKVADDLGLPVEIPGKPMKPFFDISPKIEKEAYKKAAKAHLTDSPFFVYDFDGHPQSIGMLTTISQILDWCKPVSIQEIKRAVGDDPIDTIAVMTHFNCPYAFGINKNFLYSVWTANVPNVLAFYYGDDPRWDGIHPQNVNLIDAKQYPEQEFANVTAPNTVLLTRRAEKLDKL